MAPSTYITATDAAGKLLMFDSVCIPHEVLPTHAGERVAVAGWFHEAQRPFPPWFDATMAPKRRVLR